MGPSLPLLLAPTVLSQSRGLLRYLMGGTSSPVAWAPHALMSYLLPSHAFIDRSTGQPQQMSASI